MPEQSPGARGGAGFGDERGIAGAGVGEASMAGESVAELIALADRETLGVAGASKVMRPTWDQAGNGTSPRRAASRVDSARRVMT